MNDAINCPDCKSQDLEKIQKEHIVTTNTGCINTSLIKKSTIICSFLGVLVGSILGLAGTLSFVEGFFGGLVNGLFWGVVFGLIAGFFVKNHKSETITNCHYVCRSCGKEFRAN